MAMIVHGLLAAGHAFALIANEGQRQPLRGFLTFGHALGLVYNVRRRNGRDIASHAVGLVAAGRARRDTLAIVAHVLAAGYSVDAAVRHARWTLTHADDG